MIKGAAMNMTESLGELALALWMGLSAGQPAALPAATLPTGSPPIIFELGQETRKVSDGARDWASAARDWATEGGLPAMCSISVMRREQDWDSSLGPVPSRSAMAFTLGHEIGHCFDTRGKAPGMKETVRRESYGDAFGACVALKMGVPSADFDRIRAAREGVDGGAGWRGKMQSKAIARALAQPECARSKGSRQDAIDAWEIATRVDVALFGEQNAAWTPQRALPLATRTQEQAAVAPRADE
jgi:hypothetical protein